MQVGGIEDTYGNAVWCSGRSRNAATCSSNPAQIRDTSDFEMPDPIPSAATRSSTALVETPFTHASITTAYRAWSIRRRRSRMTGKNEPCRSFGIRSSTSPACVATNRGRDPFRSVTRLGLRS